MTPPSAAAVPAVLDRRAPAVLARGVELLGELRGSGYHRAPGLVRRRDGQTLQLTPLLYAVLRAVDGHRDHRELAVAVSSETGTTLAPEDTEYLVEEKLRPLGLLREDGGAEPVTVPSNPLLALRWRFVVTDPVTTGRLTRPFATLFHPAVIVSVSLAFAATLAWLFLVHGLAGPMHATLTDPRMVLLVVGLTVVSTGFHEFGHAAACRYGGASPGVMGAGLYLVWPAFYTDVTDSYRLDRAGRLRVDLGGLYFNAVFAVAVTLVWSVLRWDALLLVVGTQVLQMVRQLVPLVRFDGYHILADLTGVPDLFAHIGPMLSGILPGHGSARRSSTLRPWVRVVVVTWVAVVVPVLAALLVGMVVLLPRVAATAWEGIVAQQDLLADHWAAGEVAAAAVRALSVLTLGLPVLAMAYLVLRVVRRSALRLWRVAGEDPRRRAGVLVTAAVTAAAVAVAWWPQGQYTPVEPAGEAVVEPSRAPAPPLSGSGEPLLAARGRAERPSPPVVEDPEPVAEPVVATSSVATAAEPVTTASTARPAWPFSWAPPAPPGPEDNRAWAVNTRDGWTITSVSIDEAWFSDGAVVAPRNEAWALAECLDCRTIAVAFQAVFVVGSSDVVTPVNAGVAANEECLRCVTSGVAVQLVASLEAVPEAAVRAEVRRVLAELEGLRGRVRTMAPEEVRAVLVAARDRILTILDTAGLLLEPGEEGAADPASEGAVPERTEPEPVATGSDEGASITDPDEPLLLADGGPAGTSTDGTEDAPSDPVAVEGTGVTDPAEVDTTSAGEPDPSTTEGTTTTGDTTTTDDALTTDDVSTTEDTLTADDVSTTEDTTSTGEAEWIDDTSATEDTPTTEDTSTADDVLTTDEPAPADDTPDATGGVDEEPTATSTSD